VLAYRANSPSGESVNIIIITVYTTVWRPRRWLNACLFWHHQFLLADFRFWFCFQHLQYFILSIACCGHDFCDIVFYVNNFGLICLSYVLLTFHYASYKMQFLLMHADELLLLPGCIDCKTYAISEAFTVLTVI